jgi:hypothetical protein
MSELKDPESKGGKPLPGSGSFSKTTESYKTARAREKPHNG